MDYGVATINIQGPYKITKIKLEPPRPKLQEFNTLAKKYNAQPQAIRVVPLKDLKTLETIYGRMTDEQKQKALPFPECAPPPPTSPVPAPKPVPPSPTLPSGEKKVELIEALEYNNHYSKTTTFKSACSTL